MKTWVVANQKGGVGKTTTAISLGGLLASDGLRTLLVDMDPQGSMTSYFGHDPDDLDGGSYRWFMDAADSQSGQSEEFLATRFDNLSLLPASTALATLDRRLGTREGMGLVLAQRLQEFANRFDHVIIDSPPVLGILMINALAAGERLIVPVQTEFLALKGLERLMRTLEMIQRTRKDPLDILIVPTMFDRRTRASIDVLQQLQQEYRQWLWDGVIPVDTLFRDASKAGIPLPLMDEKARGTVSYTLLIDHLLQKQAAGLETVL